MEWLIAEYIVVLLNNSQDKLFCNNKCSEAGYLKQGLGCRIYTVVKRLYQVLFTRA